MRRRRKCQRANRARMRRRCPFPRVRSSLEHHAGREASSGSIPPRAGETTPSLPPASTRRYRSCSLRRPPPRVEAIWDHGGSSSARWTSAASAESCVWWWRCPKPDSGPWSSRCTRQKKRPPPTDVGRGPSSRLWHPVPDTRFWLVQLSYPEPHTHAHPGESDP